MDESRHIYYQIKQRSVEGEALESVYKDQKFLKSLKPEVHEKLSFGTQATNPSRPKPSSSDLITFQTLKIEEFNSPKLAILNKISSHRAVESDAEDQVDHQNQQIQHLEDSEGKVRDPEYDSIHKKILVGRKIIKPVNRAKSIGKMFAEIGPKEAGAEKSQKLELA